MGRGGGQTNKPSVGGEWMSSGITQKRKLMDGNYEKQTADLFILERIKFPLKSCILL